MVKSVTATSKPLVGTIWTLVALAGEPLAPNADEGAPFLVLEAEVSRVSGSGGCNRLVGSFEVSANDLRLGPIAATRMACSETVMERELAFLHALDATSRYELVGESLELLADGNGVVARFVASSASAS